MSIMFPAEIKCSMCGTVSVHDEMISTSTFGTTDLDTRPPEVKRSTMYSWVQACPECGFAYRKLSEKAAVEKSFLSTQEYKTCDGISFASELARDFFRYHLILSAENKTEKAFWALLSSSWACDDVNDTQNAVLVRNRAIHLAEILMESHSMPKKNVETISLIRADMLRRTSQFEELLEKYEYVEYSEQLLNQILAFQKEMARNSRPERFTVQDAKEYFEEDSDEEKEEVILGKRDELFSQAVEIMIQEGGTSITILQRKLRIGYMRAKRLVIAMEALGIAECENGRYKSKMDMENWEILKKINPI